MSHAGNEKSRLLVLVTDGDLEEVKYAKKARSIAEARGLDILFLGIPSKPELAPQFLRRLITLSGIAENETILARYHHTPNQASWIDIISIEFKPGDFILCPSEFEYTISRAKRGFSLKEKFGNHVLTVSGLTHPIGNSQIRNLLVQILNWSGIILILTIAFSLEASLDSQTIGIMRILGEVILVSVELVTLWFWYRLFQKQS